MRCGKCYTRYDDTVDEKLRDMKELCSESLKNMDERLVDMEINFHALKKRVWELENQTPAAQDNHRIHMLEANLEAVKASVERATHNEDRKS